MSLISATADGLPIPQINNFQQKLNLLMITLLKQ